MTQLIAVSASKVSDLPLAHMQAARPKAGKTQACGSPKERVDECHLSLKA